MKSIYYKSILTYLDELQDLQHFTLINKRCQKTLKTISKTYIYNPFEKVQKRLELFGNSLEIQCNTRVLPKLFKEIPKGTIPVKVLFETDDDYNEIDLLMNERIDLLEIHFLHINPKCFKKMIEVISFNRDVRKVVIHHSVLLSLYKIDKSIKEWFDEYDCHWNIIITKDFTSSQLSQLIGLFNSLCKLSTVCLSISTITQINLNLLLKNCDNEQIKLVSYSPQYLDLILQQKIIYLWNNQLSSNYTLPSTINQKQSIELNKLYYPAFRIDSSIKSIPSVDFLSLKISSMKQLTLLKSFSQLVSLELIIDCSTPLKSIDLKHLSKLYSLKISGIRGVDSSTSFSFPLKIHTLKLINCLFSFQQLQNITMMNSLHTLILFDNSVTAMSLPTNLKRLIILNNKKKVMISNKSSLKYLKHYN